MIPTRAGPGGTNDRRLWSPPMSAFHDITMTSITGDQVSFEQFRGQVCLVVNVASR